MFCMTGLDEYSVSEAKAYIARFGYTSDDVAIKKGDNCILVVAKRKLW